MHQLLDIPPTELRAAEASVFSQAGEDGIIQKLIQHLPGIPESFVEFGVQDYRESNTRFLLMNNNWRGLAMDGSEAFIGDIQRQRISWMHDLSAKAAFITRENIKSLLAEAGFDGEVGLLSVDIDGNDYWVWEAISSRPWIVVCEYNSLFGALGRYSVPYDPAFNRTQAHSSNLYFGASLAALCALGESKGYRFVGSNSLGSNAFFVRQDVAQAFKATTAKDAHVRARSRQSRGPTGELTFLNYEQGRELMANLNVHDFARGSEVRFGDVERL